jgi:spore maturation protein CgeB
MTVPRVLTTGESWYGATGRACNAALRELGCDVAEVSIDHYVPQWRGKMHRALERLLLPIAVKEFNEALLHQAWQQTPAFFLAFKGPYVERETLREMRKMGIRLYNYYPDTSAFTHGNRIPRALPEYDCIFYTKPFWIADVRKQIQIKDAVFLDHGYDPEIHRPWPLSDKDKRQYEADVVVIGSHTPYKAKLLRRLLELRPSMDLKIWGSRWETCNDELLLNHWQLGPLNGQAYARGLQAARINLAITSGIVPGASQGDFVTTRTFQIPACKGFMLHERNPEVLALYEEGKEIACFATPEEAAEKIDHYLAHPEERAKIAEAGYQRTVPAYSYTGRMQELLKWHHAHEGETAQSAGRG